MAELGSLDEDPYGAVVIGGGPAGLSAALNLGRSRARVLVVDADRPRNAATLHSHGFLTRDGIAPHELRKLARAEIAVYPQVEVLSRTRVTSVAQERTSLFRVILEGRKAPGSVLAHAVLVATGLRETLPDVANIHAFYGMSLFSCAACDAWELQDRPLALIGETPDLAARARLIARWTDDLTVFTNGSAAIDMVEEAELTASGVRLERQPIAALEGDRGRIAAVRLSSGVAVAVDGGFVRPRWHTALEFLAPLPVELDRGGHLVLDRSGRTNIPGLYGAGDVAAPGPQQLIVAAGQGARAAAVLIQDLIGVSTSH